MKRAVLVVVLLALLCVAAHADTDTAGQTVTITVKEVALINIGANAPTFTVDMSAATAGLKPSITEHTGDVTTIKYTSVLPSTNITKRITLKLGQNVPSGLTLKATTTVGTLKACGSPTTDVTLSSTASDIITAIPTCWTDAAGEATSTMTLTVDDLDTALQATVVGTPYSTTATYTITGS